MEIEEKLENRVKIIFIIRQKENKLKVNIEQ
jgi:hypothetical protein